MLKKTHYERIEVKFAPSDDEKTMAFGGYGARFGNIDAYGDVIAKGAFAKSIAAHEAAGTMPMMFFNHDAFTMPIGVWKSMVEDEQGLVLEGELIDTSTGRDAYIALKSGAITGLSIGFKCTGFEMTGKSRTITEAELMEVSVVTFPANDLARVSDVKSTEKENPMTDEEIEKTLIEAGFEDEAVKALMATRAVGDEDEASDAESEEIGEETTTDEDETKYDVAAVSALIKSIVATTKEIHVR